MKIHEVEQGTPAWLELRKGKMTASHATAIGNCGAGLKTYINELMSEYYSSGEREYYTNKDMDRGNELEPLAAEMYEMENGVRAEKIGFVECNEFAGCSPDRLINDDGLLEIKCPDDKNYFKFLLEGEKAIKSDYIWQMQCQMFMTGRKYNIFLAYNPNFKKSMCAYRIEADPAVHAKLAEGLRIGQGLIEGIKNQLND